MRPCVIACAVSLALMALSACARPARMSTAAPGPAEPPASLLGAFADDYNGSYQITRDVWQHGSRLKYEIVSWHVDSQYLLARNAATNPSAGGLWTRIDWISLEGMPPFTWAYCLSAFKAPTRDSAQATRVANRAIPRTGCNGFPFSRMKRVPAG